jgi:hypothetical protein
MAGCCICVKSGISKEQREAQFKKNEEDREMEEELA